MRTITYSEFRKNMKAEFRRCRDDADILMVTNKDYSENVVVMNARDHDAMLETIRIYENHYLHDKIKRAASRFKKSNKS